MGSKGAWNQRSHLCKAHPLHYNIIHTTYDFPFVDDTKANADKGTNSRNEEVTEYRLKAFHGPFS
jgi:hypothetical protein